MHAFLIVGGTQTEREEIAHGFTKDIHPIDTLVLFPQPSIGIEKIRTLSHELLLKPIYSPLKVVLIYQADKMTTAAQNAFLKTLEEPPKNCLLVLTAPNTELLSSTLVSRCQVNALPSKGEINPTGKDLVNLLQTMEKILKGKVGERLSLAETVSQDRQEATNWIKMQIVLWRYILLIKHNCKKLLLNSNNSLLPVLENLAQGLTTRQIRETITKIQEAEKMLEANVNIRLVVDNLLLDYPQLPKRVDKQ